MLSSPSFCHSFQTHYGCLVYEVWPNQLLVLCFIIVVSSYSNSYELMFVIDVVIC
ncbi:unnamed protein product [Hymenolepis diminuta]|uniref:Uncharacterized protein n=1 Tax=Hymenolepis diminuta TaxID=6216 RepID=A0A564Y149_HYMDI|nr:unnamed protein product [Hymenolepis diminuta]